LRKGTRSERGCIYTYLHIYILHIVPATSPYACYFPLRLLLPLPARGESRSTFTSKACVVVSISSGAFVSILSVWRLGNKWWFGVNKWWFGVNKWWSGEQVVVG
jgi:hypothetical protein